MVSLCCDTTPVRTGKWEVTADDEGGGGAGGRGRREKRKDCRAEGRRERGMD